MSTEQVFYQIAADYLNSILAMMGNATSQEEVMGMLIGECNEATSTLVSLGYQGWFANLIAKHLGEFTINLNNAINLADAMRNNS